MKSILIEKPNQLSIIEREIPTPSAGEVRVKVKLAGICGSDSHIYRGHNPFAKYPRVIGHEFFGVIDAVGEGVESARVGERVAVDPVVSCGHCYPCSIGKPKQEITRLFNLHHATKIDAVQLAAKALGKELSLVMV